MNLVFSSILLGFGGFDPMGALIIMAALAAKAPKRDVYLFAAMALLSTVLFGTLFSSGIGTGMGHLSGVMDQIPDAAYVVLYYALAVAAAAWLVRRIFFKERLSMGEEKKESRFMTFARKSMPLAGFLFGFWAMSDPTFWTVVALTARDGDLFMRILCSGIWMVLGQLPLYALTVAVACGTHERLIASVERYFGQNGRREKIDRVTGYVINGFVIAVIAYFVVDPTAYLVTGAWL